MPTYDYLCDDCGHTFELFQQMTDSVKRKCPECKKNKLRRLFGTGAAIVFKGSGFYQTDYRSDSYKKAAEAEKKARSKDTSKEKSKEKSQGKEKGTSDGGSSKKGEKKSSQSDS